jgi:hypothetical protein
MGAEKGEGEENTVSDVTNFLLKNDFSIIDFNESKTLQACLKIINFGSIIFIQLIFTKL